MSSVFSRFGWIGIKAKYEKSERSEGKIEDKN